MFDKIKKVSQEEIGKIIASGGSGKGSDYKPLGLFYTQEDDIWTAVDNSTGDAWTEAFDTEQKAIDWLIGYEE